MDWALVLSVVVLLAAPLLARLVARAPHIKGALDGFVLITVLGLITLTLLPEALTHGGLWGLIIAAIGFSLPWITEFVFHRAEEMTHRVVMLVASLALVVHAASDGAILAFASESETGNFIAVGVLLHRVGVAVAVWWLLRPVLSTGGGLLVLAGLGAMTIVGYLLALFAGEWYNFPLVGYWQAFAAGSLLHVVLHPLEDHSAAPSKDTLPAHRIGTALGLVFVLALISAHYLHHTPGPLGDMPVHGMHHAVDLLSAVGRLIAPILLLVLLVAAVLPHVYGKGMGNTLASLQKVAPWTMLLWLGTAVFVELSPFAVPSTSGGLLLFALWLISVCALLIQMGARAFFTTLMPRVTMHKHGHSHSH
ncbi:ZIP family metal transporter [Kordiimonas aestuarii]|uniref:hypothetical protein n=1 Tax=Kordiimonas aestuarii TaxID=1005925 RepID=UPI0021D0E444|nr:hypothetical protein [Kordiimonas aestuarii]